jgi:uncharacterized protein (DUF58 family)
VREAPTPRAPSVAAVGAAMLLGGLGFDAPSLLVPGVALLLLALGAWLWVGLASRGGRLERLPGPGRLLEAERYPLRIRLRGTLLPPPGGELTDPLLERPVPVGPLWGRRLRRDPPLRGPGRYRLGSPRLLVRDPFGLATRELRSAPVGDLVVLPRLEPIELLATAGGALGEGAGVARGGRGVSQVAEVDVEGLRPYRPGSPASRIHWPAVARHGELIERRLSSGGGSRPVVVLDLRGSDGRPPAVRAAASLCFQLAAGGGCELVLPGSRRALPLDPSLRGWPEAHVRIAVAPAGAPPASTLAAAGGGPVFWVASGGPSKPPPAALRQGGYLITAERRRGEPAFKVAGCYGYPLAGARAAATPAARARA